MRPSLCDFPSLGFFDCNSFVVRLPAIEEGGNSFGAGALKLFFVLGIEEIAASIDDGEGGNAFGDGNVVLFGDVDVLVHVTDVDVDDDEVFLEELGVGILVIVDIKDLAVAAPVAAEVKEDALVLAAGADESCGDIGVGVGGLGVKIFVRVGENLRGGLRSGCKAQHEKRQRKESRGQGERDGVGLRDHGVSLIEFVERKHLGGNAGYGARYS